MSLFNFNIHEILTFFCVLVRLSVLFAIAPIFGDRTVPSSIKVLFPVLLSLVVFPSLVATGQVRPKEAEAWGNSASLLILTLSTEALIGLILGSSARLLFEGISFGANLAGNYMGFAFASIFDPHQESQTEVVAQFQMVLATLLFLSLDQHHILIWSAIESYRILSIGKINLVGSFGQRWIETTADMIRFGVVMAAPVALSIFAINAVFGVLAKAMPQLNIFAISTLIAALVGFFVLFLEIPHFEGVMSGFLGKVGDVMRGMTQSLAVGS